MEKKLGPPFTPKMVMDSRWIKDLIGKGKKYNAIKKM